MRILFLFLIVGLSIRGIAQLDEPENTRWRFQVSEPKAKPGDIVELSFTANINFGWALYSSDFSSDIGPLPTEFSFTTNDTYQLIGAIVPQNPLRKKDKTWDVTYTYFNGTAVFKQKIKILKKQYKIEGTIKGLTCSDLDGLCVPFSKDFRF